MQEKINKSYKEIIDFFSENGPVKLTNVFVQKMEFILERGTQEQKHKISCYFACCILDNHVVGYTEDMAIQLITKTFKQNKSKLPEKIYNRFLRIIKDKTCEESIGYIRLAFDLNYYDAIRDLSFILLSGELFEKNIDAYTQIMYELLRSALQTSKNKFITLIFYLLRDIEFHFNEIFSDAILLLDAAKRSEYWRPEHTSKLIDLMKEHASLHESNTMLEVNNRLQIIEETSLMSGLRSSHTTFTPH